MGDASMEASAVWVKVGRATVRVGVTETELVGVGLGGGVCIGVFTAGLQAARITKQTRSRKGRLFRIHMRAFRLDEESANTMVLFSGIYRSDSSQSRRYTRIEGGGQRGTRSSEYFIWILQS